MNNLIIVSANAEWRIVNETYPQPARIRTPFGEAIEVDIAGQPSVFIQGGWGKVSAAASAQYAIQRWLPERLINLGTCGGLANCVEKGDVILAEETIIYDIYEAMGDPLDALDFYSTRIDLSWLPAALPFPVIRTRLVSADRDIFPSEVRMLQERFGAIAADWESGAIAWVAARSNIRCLILRGVTDLVYPQGGEAYGQLEVFHNGTQTVMQKLLEALPLLLVQLK
jgi:adenosylhomocysteine nucleosidase